MNLTVYANTVTSNPQQQAAVCQYLVTKLLNDANCLITMEYHNYYTISWDSLWKFWCITDLSSDRSPGHVAADEWDIQDGSLHVAETWLFTEIEHRLQLQEREETVLVQLCTVHTLSSRTFLSPVYCKRLKTGSKNSEEVGKGEGLLFTGGREKDKA